ncbi:MAG TPA: hypothetical protein VFW60_08960 [Rhodanobacteraceae bacterium]|nr:hypothetical protein [Rhodanobacteraceae bacterium]
MPDARAATAAREPEIGADASQHSALAAVLPHILRTFRREPALALTVAYLMVALAGIYYDYGFYRDNFGIPILTLSQISDFLVAGIQQPVALALVALTLPLCWLLDRLNARFNRKHATRRDRLRSLPRLKLWQKLQLYWVRWNLSDSNRRLSQVMYLAIVLVYSWLFVSILAGHRAKAIKQGAGPHVTVRLAGEAADLRASAGTTWSYLGAVSNYVFVYDPAARQSLVLPVNAIERIQPGPVKDKPGLPFPVVHVR